ncbi:MAG: tetratricopeptide repeat protein [Bacillota bacterium]
MAKNYTPKELNDLGDKHFYGEGITKNIEVAYTYYKQAADMNNPVGIYNVGKYYEAKEAYKKAFYYYEKATELDYGKAYLKLYQFYLSGQGTRKSKKRAFKALKQAIDSQEVNAYHLLGKLYEEGIGTKKNFDKAYDLYELSANKNNKEGMYLFGEFLLKQKNKDREHENAFYWLDKAAGLGYEKAILRLKSLYNEPHPYLEKRSKLYLEEMIFHYDELLAKQADIAALKRVASAYFEGRTFLQANYEKAYKYFRALHEADEILGYLGLAKLYLYGLGINKNYDKALDYLEIASSRNNTEAKYLIGEIYRHGYGVEIDFNKAKIYYLAAAEDNLVEGLINLSLLHYRKQIKNSSFLQAFTYIKRAIESKSPKAYFWLGLYYELGIGTDKNTSEAIKAYKNAIQLGNNASRYKLANLLYKHIHTTKLSKRKQSAIFQEIKELLFTYLTNVDSDNRLKAMYLLGDLYQEDNFADKSAKTSRYYYELAAENGYAKAMNRLYELFKEEDFDRALMWLKKACENPSDGEELYLLANLYETGYKSINKDLVKAENLLTKAAELNYSKAKEKLMFENNK